MTDDINSNDQHKRYSVVTTSHIGCGMTDFVVYIDQSTVRDGTLKELKSAMRELVDFVEANEPEALAYNVYFSADGDRIAVIHMHTYQAPLEFHMAVAGPKFPPIGEFIDLESIDVYSHMSEDLNQCLKDKASGLGSGRVLVHERHRGIDRVTDN
ncbi:hypothetical protein [Halalkalicoccus sp. NIPERK01]|uniref:hypothetical protein n=1 Tax=Halalkalicoccus sp. NIPERK01 TaxID=3053469 RepID=UPI00256F2A7D|nr:hypothetical protein [Halalkalicoccus sp. NIPERK01]MDL5363146.1 hypothetical protein [Halalkalicoccus sp. NIPERK01]